MPITIVVGGQYGSEGKGKVSHWLAKTAGAHFAVRVGGPNSGHTVVSNNRRTVLRQLPTPALLDDTIAVIPAGGYVDVDVLLEEVEELALTPERLLIHPQTVILDPSMRLQERQEGLIQNIASTGQGVGAAVARRAMRHSSVQFANSHKLLRPFVQDDVDRRLAEALATEKRVLVEGTQGFGLSILHGHYPYTTSRDTTAAGALAEAGLSPRSVDCVAMVLRAFPIRVAGKSGPLPLETSWEEVTNLAGATVKLEEHTTVTSRLRRIALFHGDVVKKAIWVNRPDLVFLNHADYIDYSTHESHQISLHLGQRVHDLELQLDKRIDYVGTGPSSIVARPALGWCTGDPMLSKAAQL